MFKVRECLTDQTDCRSKLDHTVASSVTLTRNTFGIGHQRSSAEHGKNLLFRAMTKYFHIESLLGEGVFTLQRSQSATEEFL